MADMRVQRKQELVRYRQRSDNVHQQSEVKGIAREQSWPSTLMAVGVFSAIFGLVTVVPWTLIDAQWLLRGLLLLCFAGNLVPYLRSGLVLGMERLEWFLFNLLAVGPLGMGLLLWANFVFHGTVTVTEHAVYSTAVRGGFLYYELADGFLAEHPFALAVPWSQATEMGNHLRITTADGLFGVPVLVRKEPYRAVRLR
ncbi:MAG: hypothetical protein KF905_02475 [Flavobacteriales bacterium]|nr:hypothetical protein [Flavobacteriales bacterium]